MDIGSAIENYMTTRKQYDEAFQNYGGYSWGYYGSSHIEALDKANADLVDAIRSIVREEITPQGITDHDTAERATWPLRSPPRRLDGFLCGSRQTWGMSLTDRVEWR